MAEPPTTLDIVIAARQVDALLAVSELARVAMRRLGQTPCTQDMEGLRALLAEIVDNAEREAREIANPRVGQELRHAVAERATAADDARRQAERELTDFRAQVGAALRDAGLDA